MCRTSGSRHPERTGGGVCATSSAGSEYDRTGIIVPQELRGSFLSPITPITVHACKHSSFDPIRFSPPRTNHPAKKEIPAAWPLKFLVVRSDRFCNRKGILGVLPSALVRAAGRRSGVSELQVKNSLSFVRLTHDSQRIGALRYRKR